MNTVAAKFDENDIPMDVMWLDIEHTDGKKYFTWDTRKARSRILRVAHKFVYTKPEYLAMNVLFHNISVTEFYSFPTA